MENVLVDLSCRMKYQSRGLIDARFDRINFGNDALKNNAKVCVFVRMIRSGQIWTIQTVAEDKTGNVVTLYWIAVTVTRIQSERHTVILVAATHSAAPWSDLVLLREELEATKLPPQ